MEIEDKKGITQVLEGLARTAVSQDQVERAARLFGAAEALRKAIGTPIPPSDRGEYDQSVASVRARLGEETFAAAWEESRAMSMEETINYALEEGDTADA